MNPPAPAPLRAKDVRPASGAPAVSIVLPFRDAAPTLARCLDSLTAQSWADFEIVAVDDGSSDGGPAIAAEHAARDPRLRIVSQPPRGIVGALNAGLAACRGQWVARMDADDVALPTRLERQLEYMEAHRQCDLVGCLAEPFSEGGTLSPGVIRYHRWMNALRDDGAMKREIFVESPLPHPSFFAPLAFFTALGGYREVPWPEDYDLLLRAAESGAVFGKVPEVLVRRSDHPHRLTRTDPRYRRDGMFRAKAHFLARGPWLKSSPSSGGAAGLAGLARRKAVVIGGSGTSGRLAARVLEAEGVEVRCFVDNKTGPPGRRVMGLPAHGWPDEIPADFFAAHRDAVFLACIGEARGRERLRRHLEANGFREGRHWLRFA